MCLPISNFIQSAVTPPSTFIPTLGASSLPAIDAGNIIISGSLGHLLSAFRDWKALWVITLDYSFLSYYPSFAIFLLPIGPSIHFPITSYLTFLWSLKFWITFFFPNLLTWFLNPFGYPFLP